MRTAINIFTHASAICSDFYVKPENCIDISQNPKTLSGQFACIHACKPTKPSSVKLHIFQSEKYICLSAQVTLWSAWVKLLMVVRNASKFQRKSANCRSQK